MKHVSLTQCSLTHTHTHTYRHMDEEQALELKNSVLDRCVPHGDVYHVYVDRKSPFVRHIYIYIYIHL